MGASRSSPCSEGVVRCGDAVRGIPQGQSSMSTQTRGMHMAVMQNDIVRLRTLLDFGIDVDQPWQNPAQPSAKDGCTPLSEAISLNHVQIAKCLIDAHANVNNLDSAGFTPLMKAAYHGRHSLIAMLVEAGADVHHADAAGNTPLHVCVRHGAVHGNPLCVLELLRHGAQPNQRNNEGLISLHLAAAFGTSEMVAILLCWAAERDSLDHEYLTPLYHCLKSALVATRRQPIIGVTRECVRQRIGLLKIFLRAGADPLGLGSWLRQFPHLKETVEGDAEFARWCTSQTPPSLVDLCRSFLHQHMGFTDIRHKYCLRKVRALEVPETLKIYLSRRTLTF